MMTMYLLVFDPSRTKPMCATLSMNKTVHNCMTFLRNLELDVTRKTTRMRNDASNIETYGNAWTAACCTFLDDLNIVKNERPLLIHLTEYIENVKYIYISINTLFFFFVYSLLIYF